MKKILFLTAAGLLALGLLQASAQVTPPAVAMPTTAAKAGIGDQLDYLYLASDRPVRR